MSLATRTPLRFAGAVLSSGSVNTGEISFIRGGGQAACIFSGAASGAAAGGVGQGMVPGGADLLFVSGAGRLNSVLQHTQMLSGLPIIFYDSAVPTSGGPFPLSGHKILGVIPPTWAGGVAGSGSPVGFTGTPLTVDMPFQSGLWVAPQ